MRPEVARPARPGSITAATAVRPRITAGTQSSAKTVILTSVASIFLPTYSGVRPIMRPATNTVTMQYSSIP